MMAKIPRLVVAGTHSGCGKTTVAVGLMAALARKGFQVRPFKVGPDFIDPMFHKMATGTPSRNLDTWLLGKAGAKRCFLEHASGDVAVIEGVMGLFDGARPTADRGSTAEVAKLLRAPVVLVVDGDGIAGSAAAIVSGFRDFDRKLTLAGVIFNRVFGKRHYEQLRAAVGRVKGVRALGYLEPTPALKLAERRLGLVPPEQAKFSGSWIASAAEAIAKTVDLDSVIAAAHAAPPLHAVRMPPPPPPKTRLAVAQDAAFNFYYQDNLDLLRRAGAEVVPFSPLDDEDLPPNTRGLVFGGGFPEEYAGRLSRNGRMLSAVRTLIRSGAPVYAECGGMMYLAEELEDGKGVVHPMVGVIPGKIQMTPHLQNFGYANAVALHDTFVLKRGERLRGHEFHHSIWQGEGAPESSLFEVSHSGQESRLEGFRLANVHASFVHLHWRAHPMLPRRLVSATAGCSLGS